MKEAEIEKRLDKADKILHSLVVDLYKEHKVSTDILHRLINARSAIESCRVVAPMN